MIPLCMLYADAVGDNSLKGIMDALRRAEVDRERIIEHEIDRDAFIRDFIRRFESHCPDPLFVIDRLRRAEVGSEE